MQNLFSRIVWCLKIICVSILPKMVFAFTENSTGITALNNTITTWELVLKVLTRAGIITAFVIAALAMKYNPSQGAVKVITNLLIAGVMAWAGFNYVPDLWGFVI